MSTTSTDTIVIRWKGKNLSRIPVSPSDTTIAQAIDTSWKDDAGIPWNPRITYGSLPDTRDGQTYRTVKIGTQWWMAENLNFKPAGAYSGWCYNNSADSCKKYGRLYTWADVTAEHVSSTISPSGVQGICPSGWHVPSDSEWTTMQKVVDTSNATDGIKLKSTSGWSCTGNGTDDYGFRALPGGYRKDYGTFNFVGNDAYFWSASAEYSVINAWSRIFYNSYPNVYRYRDDMTDGFSLRCLED